MSDGITSSISDEFKDIVSKLYKECYALKDKAQQSRNNNNNNGK